MERRDVLHEAALALPAQAGRVIIGAEGALVLGGLAAAALGLVLSRLAPPLVVWQCWPMRTAISFRPVC
jgi:simple sugar transport system permease protein